MATRINVSVCHAVVSRLASLGVLMILFSPPSAQALDCASDSLEVFPLPGNVPPNTVFVLQGRGVASPHVRGIAIDRIELRTREGNYPLRIAERRDEPVAWLRFAAVEPQLRAGQLELWLLLDAGRREPQWIHHGTWNVQGVADESYPRVSEHEHRATVKVQDSMWGKSLSA